MPTVEAGPTTRQMPTNTATGAEPSLLDLISEKDDVVMELESLGSALQLVSRLEAETPMRIVANI